VREDATGKSTLPTLLRAVLLALSGRSGYHRGFDSICSKGSAHAGRPKCLYPRRETPAATGVQGTRSSGMPLTAFQKRVAHVLAANRNPEDYIAGGAAINRTDSSLRFSKDLDIFHDEVRGAHEEAARSIAVSAEADERTLLGSGYAVEWLHRSEGHYRALVT